MLRSRMNQATAARIFDESEAPQEAPTRPHLAFVEGAETYREPELAPMADEPRVLPAPIARLKEVVHSRIVEDLDQSQLLTLDATAARDLVRRAAGEILALQQVQGIAQYREALLDEIVDEVLGLGPLEPLLRDDTISEIMVNGPDQVYVERGGRLYKSNYVFKDEGHVARVVERIVSPLGRHVDEASPMADARLPDGSRVNVVAPPASPNGLRITLRKFARKRLRGEDLVIRGALTPQSLAFLRACVQAKLNILVSGGTGSGKTTLLNVLSSFIGDTERIVTIEDPLEVQLQQPHVVALEARPPGIDGAKPVTQRDLVRNSLRMRPDRIIIGEVRGGEAFDMLQAMNTGHEGSLSTVHANTPRDALSRVENMVLMAGFDLPAHAIREQIASAVHLIVQVARMTDGSRKVTQISEVAGMEGQTVTLQDIFHIEGAGKDERGRVTGTLSPTGLQPRFSNRFEEHGVELPSDLLRTERW